MEDLKPAMNLHMDQMLDMVDKISAELRSGFQPAVDNFLGFFFAIDWKEPWLMCLLAFQASLLLIVIFSRKNVNFQMCLFLVALTGVYFAERINAVLHNNWESFASQNYFDQHGILLSVLWSGPLLCVSILILMNTPFSLCHLIVRWKKAELRHPSRVPRNKHRSRVSRNKQD